jgi:AraC-like DNA-binding protein
VDYIYSTPSRPLGDFVERLWMLNDVPLHSKERIVPSGTIELVINLHEDELRIYDPARPQRCRRFSGAAISGTYGGPFVIDTREHTSIMGVHFRPGGAFPFLGTEASELADAHVDLEALWGTSARELRERLCAAKTSKERFSLLESALTNHLFRPLEHHYAVQFALDSFRRADPDLAVGDVARGAGVSQRRFIQLFAREVGMSPKLFCRVRRFQRTLALLQKNTADWSQLVLECGYFDQSHFIRDFRNFSGLQPTQYLSQRNPDVMENHVPLAR